MSIFPFDKPKDKRATKEQLQQMQVFEKLREYFPDQASADRAAGKGDRAPAGRKEDIKSEIKRNLEEADKAIQESKEQKLKKSPLSDMLMKEIQKDSVPTELPQKKGPTAEADADRGAIYDKLKMERPEKYQKQIPKELEGAAITPVEEPESEGLFSGISDYISKNKEGLKKLALYLGPAALAYYMTQRGGGRYGTEWGQAIGAGLEKGLGTYYTEQKRLEKEAKDRSDAVSDRRLKKMNVLLRAIEAEQREYQIKKNAKDVTAESHRKTVDRLMKEYQMLYDEELKWSELQRKKAADKDKGSQKAKDEFNKLSAKEMFEYQKERSRYVNNLKTAKKAMQQIMTIKPSRWLGLAPDKAQAYFNSNAKALQEMIDEKTIVGLRETYGPQFTQVEGDLFRALKYNPSLPWHRNLEKQRAVAEKYLHAIKEKDRKYKYWQQNNQDMTGWQLDPLPEFRLQEPQKQAPAKQESQLKMPSEDQIQSVIKSSKLDPNNKEHYQKVKNALIKRLNRGK